MGIDLNQEYKFYENQLLLIDQFFDDNNDNNNNKDLIVNDDEFINQIASEIDNIYNIYTLDLQEIEHEQRRYENELNQRELKQFELAKYYKNDDDKSNDIDSSTSNMLEKLIETEKKRKLRLESMNVDHYAKDRLIYSNFVQSNKNN